jgi:hypothetical protein
MSVNSSSEQVKKTWNWRMAFIAVMWVLAGFTASQVIIYIVFSLLDKLGVPLIAIGPAFLQTIAAVLVYILTLTIVIGGPWLLKKKRITLDEIGLGRLPTWKDIGLAPVGFVVYFISSATLLFVLSSMFTGIDVNQIQETGFDNLARQTEFFLAFLTLVVVAPIAEETLFRGYLYGKLRKYIPIWLAAVVVSLLFGIVHGQVNVAIDTFVLGMVMCGLREVTGSIWAGILLHVTKNALAFYLLFINPSVFGIIGS